MQSHLLHTAGGNLAEASPDNPTRGIGHRADHPSARQPPLWRGFFFMGKTLRTVRRLLPDDAAPLVCPGLPSNAYTLTGLHLSGVETGLWKWALPREWQRLSKNDKSAATTPSGYSEFSKNIVPPDHGGDILGARRPPRNSLDLVAG